MRFEELPFRIGTPPEVAVLTLRVSTDGDARISEAPK